MARLGILTQASVDALRDNIADNIDRYECNKPEWEGALGAEYKRETAVKTNGPLEACFASETFRGVRKKEDILRNEASRCIAIYSALNNLTPQQATDERVWVYLTHFVFWDYARARWAPLPRDRAQKIRSIESHFFLGKTRDKVHSNTISRLWWMAHVCSRVKNCALQRSLRALLHTDEVRREVMEHPGILCSESILNVVMKHVMHSYESEEKKLHARGAFCQLVKRLNVIGGTIVLDSLPQDRLESIVLDVMDDLFA